ncbi:hypothetical protein MAXJ12_34199 [Mesorhizobium alhagi CCNWXJ12-2]|uniref:Uncharacterized protein n=1 Tax=Mesorhizobium alhagi CCNWXJ12-2 TaxID=1107882 RepID=H0I2Y2_9HYPH|nr:hypothetical protein MAXJ12_34199 [Mesorhizobium alhagi CCNWXJ12-2]
MSSWSCYLPKLLLPADLIARSRELFPDGLVGEHATFDVEAGHGVIPLPPMAAGPIIILLSPEMPRMKSSPLVPFRMSSPLGLE